MPDCDIVKIDSNVTGLAYAEEECLSELPESPIFYDLEPNSYSDFGGDFSTTARSPIDPSRQNSKGTITDLDASGGFNQDFTQTNLTRLLQGFYFADARELPNTNPMNSAAIVITGVVASTKTYAAASGLGVFDEGSLVMFSGFSHPANNGLKTVASSTTSTLVVVETCADETPGAAANAKMVGFQFPSADVALTVTAGVVALNSTDTDLTSIAGLIPGAWVFLGDDSTTHSFALNGYARVGTITADAITFDATSWTVEADAGTGKTVRMYFGTIIKNEDDPTLIKMRSYHLERTLGQGENGTQGEYLVGAIANQLTLNIPAPGNDAKLNIDLSFVGTDDIFVSGDEDDTLIVGTHIPAPSEDAFNSTSHIFMLKTFVIDPANTNAAALFGYVSEGNLSIDNNVSATKAVGKLGAIAATAGNFVVSGSLTAYFTNVAAVKAIRQNADVGLTMICAQKNAGFVFDVPLLGLGGGRIDVEKDKEITLPLTPNGAKNKNGYTMLHQRFDYLPTVAMPD